VDRLPGLGRHGRQRVAVDKQIKKGSTILSRLL
jgi:hypothetical protein